MFLFLNINYPVSGLVATGILGEGASQYKYMGVTQKIAGNFFYDHQETHTTSFLQENVPPNGPTLNVPCHFE